MIIKVNEKKLDFSLSEKDNTLSVIQFLQDKFNNLQLIVEKWSINNKELESYQENYPVLSKIKVMDIICSNKWDFLFNSSNEVIKYLDKSIAAIKKHHLYQKLSSFYEPIAWINENYKQFNEIFSTPDARVEESIKTLELEIYRNEQEQKLDDETQESYLNRLEIIHSYFEILQTRSFIYRCSHLVDEEKKFQIKTLEELLVLSQECRNKLVKAAEYFQTGQDFYAMNFTADITLCLQVLLKYFSRFIDEKEPLYKNYSHVANPEQQSAIREKMNELKKNLVDLEKYYQESSYLEVSDNFEYEIHDSLKNLELLAKSSFLLAK